MQMIRFIATHVFKNLRHHTADRSQNGTSLLQSKTSQRYQDEHLIACPSVSEGGHKDTP